MTHTKYENRPACYIRWWYLNFLDILYILVVLNVIMISLRQDLIAVSTYYMILPL